MIIDSTLRSLLSPQLQKYFIKIQVHVWLWVLYICQKYKFLVTIMLWSLFRKKCKDQIQNSQNRSSGEKANRVYETYKTTVIPHGRHIYAKASDMEKATMCAYLQSDHELSHWKCVMQYCDKCPSVNLPDQETDNLYSNTSSSIRFHIYHLIARCREHGSLSLNDKKICRKCKHYFN